MGKGESASNQHLPQFPLGFPKSYFQRRKWRRGLVGDFFFLEFRNFFRVGLGILWRIVVEDKT